jgi:hypothetical protein
MKILLLALIFGLGFFPSSLRAQESSQAPDGLSPTQQQAWDDLTRLGNSAQFADPSSASWRSRSSSYGRSPSSSPGTTGGIDGVNDRICESMAKYGMSCSGSSGPSTNFTPSSFQEKSYTKPTSPIDPQKVPEPGTVLAVGGVGVAGRWLLRR